METVSVVPTINDYSARSYPVADICDYLKLCGRYDKLPLPDSDQMGITMDNACNYMGFVADCEGDVTLDINIYIDQNKDKSMCARYFSIYVDGVKQPGRPYIIGASKEHTDCTLTLASGLEKGKHLIEVYRQNEPLKGAMILKSINMKGVPLIEKPADKDLYIEFVGDSITAGYGNLAVKGVENPGHAKNSDATSTYAFLTAQALNADISVLCRSGMGFSLKSIPFADYYTQTCLVARPGKKYVSNREPDIVVINLGTNDNVKTDISEITEYTQKAIKTVRDFYPNCTIVWAYGLMGTHIEKEIKAGLENCGGEANNIYYCQLKTDYSGGGGHTSAAGHIEGAKDLTKFLKSKGLV